MKTDWIKTTDRAPTEADLPVWLQINPLCPDYKARPATNGIVLAETIGIVEANIDSSTHWRPAKDDIPEPPKEETQAEKDSIAFRAWVNDTNGKLYIAPTWHAALAYERAEVAKMLPICHPNQFTDEYTLACTDAVADIRARCEGGGQ